MELQHKLKTEIETYRLRRLRNRLLKMEIRMQTGPSVTMLLVSKCEIIRDNITDIMASIKNGLMNGPVLSSIYFQYSKSGKERLIYVFIKLDVFTCPLENINKSYERTKKLLSIQRNAIWSCFGHTVSLGPVLSFRRI